MKKYFVTFAEGQFKNSISRLRNQVSELNFFDNMYFQSTYDLDINFLKKNLAFINNNKRGYGYYIWKPQIIKQIYDKMEDGDILVYLDVGCHICKEGEKRFLEYIELVQKHGILAMRLPHKEKYYTKNYVMNKFKDVDGDTYQIAATIQFYCKQPKVTEFINKYVEMTNDHQNFDDTLDPTNESSFFIDHRHDQSCFSLLLKHLQLDKAVIEDETYWSDWNAYRHFPIHARRDRN
jgi:hypothetical protein